MGYPLSETFGDETDSRVARLELLLREAYHRIANSLQVASAIVGREARALRDPLGKARLIATQQHIEAIAGVHAMLSLTGSAQMVPLQGYLERLVTGLQRTSANTIGSCVVSLRCDSVDVPPELAMSVGMIVNELVVNACKYAYRQDAPGEVRIRYAGSPERFMLEVEDDGSGFDPHREPEGTGLGTAMIGTIARHIGAEFRYDDYAGGTRAVVQRLAGA